MKKVLLASTALVLSAGIAAAEVSVGGDGRMGVIDDFGAADVAFTSRIRISFSASGETDAGLAFGGSIRVDNGGENTDSDLDGSLDAGGGVNGAAGSVFVEGSFGKLSMGDVSGAAEAAVGDVSGVGLTGLSDFNEMTYLSNGDRPDARWDYITGDLGLHVSADNPGGGGNGFGIGASYGFGMVTLSAGFESVDDGTAVASVTNADHWVVGATAALGDATVKAIYGDSSDLDFTQAAVSLDYVFGATTATVFYRTNDTAGVDVDGFGIGLAYDLGGGASLKAGYVDIDDGVAATDDDAFDFGISMSF